MSLIRSFLVLFLMKRTAVSYPLARPVELIESSTYLVAAAVVGLKGDQRRKVVRIHKWTTKKNEETTVTCPKIRLNSANLVQFSQEIDRQCKVDTIFRINSGLAKKMNKQFAESRRNSEKTYHAVYESRHRLLNFCRHRQYCRYHWRPRHLLHSIERKREQKNKYRN